MERELAPLHPIVVHFAIAFLMAGVLFRLAWLAGALLRTQRLAFAGSGACVLLLLGTLAAFVSVRSGESARGDAEGVPGAELAVREHADWAGWTLRLFTAVAVLEAAALWLARFGKATPALIASGVLGIGGLFLVYETGDHGGKLVYSHAGGVGTRSGDLKDVGRLLLAGLYQQSVVDRAEGRPEEAARLLELAAARFPGDVEVQLLLAESQLEDLKDAGRALSILERTEVPRAQAGLRLRHGVLMVDALLASGRAEQARAELARLDVEFPENGLVRVRKQRLNPP
ncbi:MAG TPA: DUF2231 domain-containing protein [Vicinamibacteria bacterium]